MQVLYQLSYTPKGPMMLAVVVQGWNSALRQKGIAQDGGLAEEW